MTKILELKGINVIRNKNLILDNISLSIDDSDFLGLLGPSGSGKTTLLQVICGLLVPDTGKLNIPTEKNQKSVICHNQYLLYQILP